MKNNTIQNVPSDACSGCAACMNACPHDCITMQFDAEGFSAPVVDESKCVDCGLCQKICPSLHPKKDNDITPRAFAARADESILYESTSGAAFAILAKYVLDRNGYVCGAAYDDQFEVHHQIVDSYEGLKKLKKTKYVQCQPGMSYRKVKELLLEDNYVLFSGAPCQVAGLHNYLGKSYDKLYTIDILCHGAPAPMSWKKYLTENFDVSTLEDIEFRYKTEKGARPLKMRFIFKDGTEVKQRTPRNPYYYHFSKNMGLRMSCGDCEGSIFPRVGDFSIGDFWGADIYYEHLVENAKGLSIIFCNNDHAKELIPYLEKEFPLWMEVSLKESMTKNRRNKERKMPETRKVFFDALRKGSAFNDSVAAARQYAESLDGVVPGGENDSEALKKGEYDVAIFGNTLGANYGGLLTYFALYKACEKLGYSTVMLRRGKKPTEGKVPHGTRFSEEYINLSEPKELKDFKEFNDLADTFILGSDQVWNQILFTGSGLSFYLDFVNNNRRKISYSASFGFDKPQLPREQYYLRPEIYHWLNEFDAISVREASGVDICKNYYDTDATHVLDPVFLVNPEEYKTVAKRAARKPKGRYIATYQLTPNKGMVSVMQYVSKKLRMPRVNMGPGSVTKWERKIVNTDEPWIPDIQIEEWLYNMANSKFIITDSFHGLCFAIMFRKNFILFLRDKGPTSRVESLLSKLGLEDRWFRTWKEFSANCEIIHKKIDYDKVHAILKKEIDSSLSWLKDAVEGKKYVHNLNIEDVMAGTEPSGIGVGCENVTDYIDSVKKNNEEVLIAAAFDSTETKAGGDFSIQKGAVAYIYDSTTGDNSASNGDFAHKSAEYGGLRIAVAAGKPNINNSDNYRELIVDYGTRKNVFRCNKHNGFVAVFAPNGGPKDRGRLIDFVYVDTAGRIIREL